MKHLVVATRTAALERLRPYVERRVLPALGFAGAPFDLDVAPEGTRSIVLFLTVGGERFVVRGDRDFVQATRTVFAMRHLIRRGAPIPRLLVADLSPVTRVRYGATISVEEMVPGRSLDEVEVDESMIRPAATALARLHAITRSRWGAMLPGVGRKGGYFRALTSRVERRLDDLAANVPDLRPLTGADVRSWFRGFEGDVEPKDVYSACHLRVSNTNLLVTDAGDARLIDVATARYGHPGIDVERALQRWCRRRKRLEAAFLDEYFRASARLTRSEWERVRPYFGASFHVTQVYRAAKEIRQFTGDGRWQKIGGRRRTVRRNVERMFDVIAGHVGPAGRGGFDEAREASLRGLTAWEETLPTPPPSSAAPPPPPAAPPPSSAEPPPSI